MCFPGMWLTGCAYEVKETLLREQRVFQAPEVELQNAGNRVDVMIGLIVHQRILSYRQNVHLIHSFIIHYHQCSLNTALEQSVKSVTILFVMLILNIKSAVIFPHLLLQDAPLMHYASKKVYMSIMGSM